MIDWLIRFFRGKRTAPLDVPSDQDECAALVSDWVVRDEDPRSKTFGHALRAHAAAVGRARGSRLDVLRDGVRELDRAAALVVRSYEAGNISIEQVRAWLGDTATIYNAVVEKADMQ